MMKRLTATVAILLISFGFSANASAEFGISVQFSKDEIRIIEVWYRDNAKSSKSHGHGKGLPPGIAKNLAAGKALPPGIAKQNLPLGLNAELPAPPKGYERLIVDGKVLLVEIATRMIHDVLTDIVD
jgi:hypothetical protein